VVTRVVVVAPGVFVVAGLVVGEDPEAAAQVASKLLL
jgi:hypothetical protein